MIRRNTASQVITLPFLGLTADGSAVTSGASLTVLKDGTSGASAGTLSHVSGGVWKYTLTQGETDAAIVGLILAATDAIPVVLNLVTTNLDTTLATQPVTVTTNNDKTGYSLTAGTGLGNQTANITGSLSGSVGSVSGAVGSVTGNVGGNVTGSVGSVVGLSAEVTKILDRLGYIMAQEIGACADAGTSAETYAITIDTTTYTIDHTGLDATGNRGTAALTKT